MRTTCIFLLITFEFVACLTGQELQVNEARPLGKLVLQLVKNYGFLVNYEESPYQPNELATTVYPDGRKFTYPLHNPLTLKLQVEGGDASAKVIKGIQSLPLAEELIPRLVAEYNKSGNPGHFSVRFDGEYTSIVGERSISRQGISAAGSLLDVRVKMDARSQLCSETLRELYSQIQQVIGENVGEGLIPANSKFSHNCTISGSVDLTARQVLLQILKQMGDHGPGNPTTRLVYWLAHDSNGGGSYFLSVYGAPGVASVADQSRKVDVTVAVPTETGARKSESKALDPAIGKKF